MIQSYHALQGFVQDGVIKNVRDGAINGSSIDVHLGSGFMRERYSELSEQAVDLSKRESMSFNSVMLSRGDMLWLHPGEFILAHTEEEFNLPLNLSAHFMLKSSIARNGINQMAAAWADPGWNKSTLTLELKNDSRFHKLGLRVGMPIGQMIFHLHQPVPYKFSYAERGRYNGDATVQNIKL